MCTRRKGGRQDERKSGRRRKDRSVPSSSLEYASMIAVAVDACAIPHNLRGIPVHGLKYLDLSWTRNSHKE
eukprot:scaffold738_cov340-Pavlova_lutheri.AAC.31